MIVYVARVCDWDVLSVKVFCKSMPPPLALPCLPCFLTGSITHLLYVGSALPFFFFFLLQHRVFFVFVVLYVVSYPAAPSPPLSPLLPSPNIFGLQLVCFALLPEFRLQSQNRPWLLVFPVMRRKEGKAGRVKGVKAPRTPAHDKDGPLPGSIGMQIECPPPVSAAAPLLQPTNTTHTHTHTTCTHARLISSWHIYPWKTAGIIFPLLCVSS